MIFNTSAHVYIEVRILEWKRGENIGGSKKWVSWSVQPIHVPNAAPVWARTYFTGGTQLGRELQRRRLLKF